MNSQQCTLYSVHCTVYIVQWTVCSVHYIVYIVQCTLCSVHCIVHIVECLEWLACITENYWENELEAILTPNVIYSFPSSNVHTGQASMEYKTKLTKWNFQKRRLSIPPVRSPGHFSYWEKCSDILQPLNKCNTCPILHHWIWWCWLKAVAAALKGSYGGHSTSVWPQNMSLTYVHICHIFLRVSNLLYLQLFILQFLCFQSWHNNK